uniref:Uncharacterized protein n=1 Tax=Ditylenchus dipsaci TaxID=166011 RepID=A0A915DJE4_9BILA
MSKYIPPCRSLERIACELMEPYRSDAEFCSKCPKRMVEVPKPTFAVPDGSSDAFTMAGEMAKIEEILEDMMLENDTLSSSSSSSSNKILVKSCTYSRELLLSVNQRLLLKGMGDLECPKTKTPKLIGELIDVTKINWIRTRKPKIAEHERANLSASDGNICRGPSRQPRVAFSESQPHLWAKRIRLLIGEADLTLRLMDQKRLGVRNQCRA